tara:strand:- start:1232 stop:1630 length:399 start_codon:yes stop_codon:yes gene_type:complete
MDKKQTTYPAPVAPATLYRDGPNIARIVFVGDSTLELVHHWMLEKLRLANEDGVTRFILDVESATPDFPPSALIEEIEFFGENAPRGIRIAYISSEMRIARHFMMIRAAAFAKGLDVEVFDTVDDARAWLGD